MGSGSRETGTDRLRSPSRRDDKGHRKDSKHRNDKERRDDQEHRSRSRRDHSDVEEEERRHKRRKERGEDEEDERERRKQEKRKAREKERKSDKKRKGDGLKVVDDDNDEDMWVEKEIDAEVSSLAFVWHSSSLSQLVECHRNHPHCRFPHVDQQCLVESRKCASSALGRCRDSDRLGPAKRGLDAGSNTYPNTWARGRQSQWQSRQATGPVHPTFCGCWSIGERRFRYT